MPDHSHRFVEEYTGLVGFGQDRETDESSLIVYLQKFSDDDLMKVTRELATKIAKGPPIAIELMKRAVYRDILSRLDTKLDFESYGQGICHQSEDHKEGVASFLEKREAHFRGM